MFLPFLASVLSAYRDIPVIFDLVVRDETPDICKGQVGRTLFGIIWSCTSTIIICAWSSVHPNIPPPNKWKARWNRLRIMFWMIVAPELVLAWAVRQWFAAKEIRDAYNERHPELPKWKRWTCIHGQFFEMGGFTLIDPDRKDAEPNEQTGVVLSLDYFKQNQNINIPEITTAEIKDRSKGDSLFKLITILQTSWFIMQCIARAKQQLALTELELITLALASLNVVTFAIWWHKPLGVQEPVKIYLKTEVRPFEKAVRKDEGNLSFDDVLRRAWIEFKNSVELTFGFLFLLCSDLKSWYIFLSPVLLAAYLVYVITFPLFILFPLCTVALLRFIEMDPVPQAPLQNRGLLAARIIVALQDFRYKLSTLVGHFVSGRLDAVFQEDENYCVFLFAWYILLPLLFVFLLLFTALLTPFLAVLFLISFVFTAVFGIVTTSELRPGASHVPSFYAPMTVNDRWSRMAVFALFGVIFGGLHCIGWDFKYPTRSEQTLWRATSLAITVIPLVAAPIDFLLATRLQSRDIKSCQTFERRALLLLDLIMTILLFVYVPARLSLIAQAIALLRSQPPSALVAVDWTKYVPHLFS